MLKNEFEERIGRSVSDEEYVEANAMYMSAGDIDKDVFCREWLKVGGAELVKGLFETAYGLNKALQEDRLVLKESQEIVSDAADAMLEVALMLLGGETAEHSEGESGGQTAGNTEGEDGGESAEDTEDGGESAGHTEGGGPGADAPGRVAAAVRLLTRKAWWLVGMKEVVKRKLRIGMSLTAEEVGYVDEHLR